MSRVAELLKGAVELNLRYTSTLLHLTKDYLKEANEVLRRERAGPVSPEPDGSAAAGRAPLLVVGRAGEIGNGAFAINNSSDREMNVQFVVQGELVEPTVTVDSARVTLNPGERTIVRILARIEDNLVIDHDYLGSIVAPGLTHQGVPFIVRRLRSAEGAPETAAAPAPRKARAGSKSS
jgi:hypothetical protein